MSKTGEVLEAVQIHNHAERLTEAVAPAWGESGVRSARCSGPTPSAVRS